MKTVEDRLAQLDYLEAVLGICWEADNSDMAFWRPWPENGPMRAMAMCSDWFWWGTADCEEIAPDDVPLLRACLGDLLSVERDAGPEGDRNDRVATAYLPQLFASRKREMRPMRCVYEDKNAIGPLLAALFDAAGPERTDSSGKRETSALNTTQHTEET